MNTSLRRWRAPLAAGIFLLVASARGEILSEFIWEKAPFPSAHASTIAETAEGALVAAWFGGTDEGNSDVGIWLGRKEPGGAWSAPAEVYKEPRQPAWNPVLFRGLDGAMHLYFKVGPSPQEWTGLRTQSADGGKTWSAPEWLASGMLGPVRAKPIWLSNGWLLAGTSWESYKAWASYMELSEDGGKSWKKYGPISFGDPELDGKGTIQPTLMEIRPGVVRGFFRTRGMGKLATATSEDYGKNWGPLKLTELDHPGVGIDAVRLADGRCLLIHNPSRTRRSPISVAVSSDDGETWKDFAKLDELAEGQRGEFSYPAMIQGAAGDIHITYTWNRKKIKYVKIPLADVPK